MLSVDEILALDDLPRERVAVPEWGGEVFIRTMRGDERDEFEGMEALFRKGKETTKGMRGFRARLVVFTACCESGELMFKPEQSAALGQKSSSIVSRLFDVAAKLNGFTNADVEELEKN
jgi:hypothetical protein